MGLSEMGGAIWALTPKYGEASAASSSPKVDCQALVRPDRLPAAINADALGGAMAGG